jgi:hypothetical protein
MEDFDIFKDQSLPSEEKTPIFKIRKLYYLLKNKKFYPSFNRLDKKSEENKSYKIPLD